MIPNQTGQTYLVLSLLFLEIFPFKHCLFFFFFFLLFVCSFFSNYTFTSWITIPPYSLRTLLKTDVFSTLIENNLAAWSLCYCGDSHHCRLPGLLWLALIFLHVQNEQTKNLMYPKYWNLDISKNVLSKIGLFFLLNRLKLEWNNYFYTKIRFLKHPSIENKFKISLNLLKKKH